MNDVEYMPCGESMRMSEAHTFIRMFCWKLLRAELDATDVSVKALLLSVCGS